MAVDLRQVVAAFLTMSMFIMLGNMIKKDHIDPLIVVKAPASLGIQHNVLKIQLEHVKLPWMEDVQTLKPCWRKLSIIKEREQTNGFIYFSLTNGPEYHAFQVANAIYIAKHLGATLVLPDIKGVNARTKRNFGEIYDRNHFLTSLHDVVQVAEIQFPYQQRTNNITIVKLPKSFTKEFVSSNIEPILRKRKHVQIASQYHPLTMQKEKETNDFLNPYACLAMYESLTLQPELERLVDSMTKTLQFLSLKSSGGKFIAVDLKVDDFKLKSCQNNDMTNNKFCYGPQDIGQFLKTIGFQNDTILYLTQTGWHKSLQPLKEYFPNTFTKDALIPFDLKGRYLGLENFQYEKFIDFKLCIQSNVFVPASSNLFYASVVGMRIALGKMQIFVPSKSPSNATMNHLSPYVVNKSHFAYSCLC